jgi:hypothetical protein
MAFLFDRLHNNYINEKIDIKAPTFVLFGKGVTTCFDLHRVIIRKIYRNVILVIELFF